MVYMIQVTQGRNLGECPGAQGGEEGREGGRGGRGGIWMGVQVLRDGGEEGGGEEGEEGG